jgi:hypothetical protein
MLPTGRTVGEQLIPELREIATSGDLPPLLPGLPQRATIISLSAGEK